MKYNGTELKEFTSERAVVFDPPKKMLVWNFGDLEPCERTVMAYVPGRTSRSVIAKSDEYSSCAEIPEAPKPRRATNLELMKWLAQGKGLFTNKNARYEWGHCEVDCKFENDACPNSVLVRKWDDGEWHEPTADYMGLEG